ncbi:helix-turn-helix transcriptional regulator [Chromobacterium amazonense]|uniref:Helix-turn-helix transcriptional regulator n=1 Tax=Chromobacterium amazonense TaxID=1382803 RepID=A0ABU8V4C9_9NEIS|nr:helix-turn-helix transcriptional regulator [Chromobacterium amazonense]MDQ4539552.1 helix-turn-helix transcriptional regulator [Chromobacterium amazonense]
MSNGAHLPDISRLASLLSDPGRARMLLLLLDGRSYPASELARHAGLSAQSASNHLAKLLQGGAVKVEQHGRHRYYLLANAAIAQALEALSAAAHGHDLQRPRAASPISPLLRLARTCYDHLAGRLGIAIADAMQADGLLLLNEERQFEVTASGRRWFAAALGVTAPSGGKRPLARACLDWSERRPHLAGAFGAALCREFQQRNWVERRLDSRALRVTPAGQAFLREQWGIRPETLTESD